MRELIEAYCDKHGVSRPQGRKFNEELYESIFANEARRKEMYNETFKGAQGLWTSALVFKVRAPPVPQPPRQSCQSLTPVRVMRNLKASDKLQPELCSMINEALKEDCRLLLPSAVGLIKAINKCLITRSDGRQPGEIRFPPGGLLYRGASLPQEHIAFFAKGAKFRYPRCSHIGIPNSHFHIVYTLSCSSSIHPI